MHRIPRRVIDVQCIYGASAHVVRCTLSLVREYNVSVWRDGGNYRLTEVGTAQMNVLDSQGDRLK